MHFTLNDIRSIVHPQQDAAAFTAVERLLGFLLALTPAIPGVTPEIVALAFNLLAVKGELTHLAGGVLATLTRRRATAETPEEYARRMQAAQTMLVYEAFLAELDEALPAELRAEETATKTRRRKRADTAEALADVTVAMPHPAESFGAHVAELQRIWTLLLARTLDFIRGSAAWKAMSKADRATAARSLRSLPARAAIRYRRGYLALAAKEPEFFAWSALAATERIADDLESVAGRLRELSSFLDSPKLLDRMDEHRRKSWLTPLQNGYDDAIERPVIEQTPGGVTGNLVFPPVREMFVPQTFSVLRYTGSELLETEQTWASAQTSKALGVFLMNFLRSPHSETTPLVILGHPGSGKSLLTQMLAARLGCKSHYVFRVELRSVAADSEIHAQVEEHIGRIIGSREVDWNTLASAFDELPGVVILDGYDELLQTTGVSYSGYLTRVQQFQMQELAVRKRPVRVIVTSRLNLIDKATIPIGATIVRLYGFDPKQRETWISRWNRHNTAWFERHGVEPFTIPETTSLDALAEQPLLLLMLAIYDSDRNALRQAASLSGTELYDRLIRRFVQREASKSQRFLDLPDDKRRDEIEKRIEHLGIAAVAMFNRKSLFVSDAELSEDLQLFGDVVPSDDARALSPAARVVGGFFFIHRPESRTYAGALDRSYEFLHNTFGEFLTADYILRQLVKHCRVVAMLEREKLELELRQKLHDPAALPERCLYALAFAPLFARPVVLHMLRELLLAHLERERLEPLDFQTTLRDITTAQIATATRGEKLPDVGRVLRGARRPQIPFVGLLATSLLNLVTVTTLLNKLGWHVEDKPGWEETGTWDALVHLWRAWFPAEALAALADFFVARREHGMVWLQPGAVMPPITRLEKIARGSQAIGDELTRGLALLGAAAAGEGVGNVHESAKALRNGGVAADFIFEALALEDFLKGYFGTDGLQVVAHEVEGIVEEGLEDNTGVGVFLFHAALLARATRDRRLAEQIKQTILAIFETRSPSAPGELLRAYTVVADSSELFALFLRNRQWKIRDLPVAVLSRVAGSSMAHNRPRSVTVSLAAQLEQVAPESLPPRLLVASLRLAHKIGPQDWFGQLYHCAKQRGSLAELTYGLDDAGVEDLVRCAERMADDAEIERIYAEVLVPRWRRTEKHLRFLARRGSPMIATLRRTAMWLLKQTAQVDDPG